MKLLVILLIVYIIHHICKKLVSTNRPRRTSEITVRYNVSDSGGYEGYNQPSGKTAKWIESGKSVSIRGYNIPGGLIYVGEKLWDYYRYGNAACLINTKLKTSPAEPWEAVNEMGYWPQYGYIPAKCRGAYLKWLAGGRTEPKAYIGYVFLFFYGLERRLLIDGQKGDVSAKERLDIVNEVRRLLKIYGGNRSLRGYASNFLAMEWILY